MAESILTRIGFGSDSTSSGNVSSNGLKTEIIMSSCLWPVPNISNKNFSVRIFGGGGGGGYIDSSSGWSGGGGGGG